MKKLLVLILPVLLIGCTTSLDAPLKKQIPLTTVKLEAKKSQRQRLKEMIVNDYRTYQSMNYERIKQQNVEDQMTELSDQINEVVISLVSALKSDAFEKPIIIRPMNIKSNEVIDKDSSSSGALLVESSFETQLKAFGFAVFDDRQPKGKLDGTELILKTEMFNIGENYYLLSSIKALDSNKLLATNTSPLNGFFFKKIIDGVEVYQPSNEFGDLYPR
jgi:formylmethanofuran dehydrogenase subunit D